MTYDQLEDEIKLMIERSTDYVYDGENEIEQIDPWCGAMNIVHFLRSNNLLQNIDENESKNQK